MLRFEIRSESEDMVREIEDRIEDIIVEVSSSSGAEVTLDVFATRKPGGITTGHPLARKTRSVIKALGIQPRLAPSVSELSAFINHQIPAITIGITYGEHQNTPEEEVSIEPIFTGLAQLIGILLAIDRGFCSAN